MSNRILNYWESQAIKHGAAHDASWGDVFAIQLEIDTIGKYIQKDDKVLDVGCANGYSTLSQLNNLGNCPSNIVGIDFSPAMIAAANQSKKVYPEQQLADRVDFLVGDIEDLNFKDNTFDVVYTTRVLINLPSWEKQQKGISECLRVCKKGGKVIFSEAFWEPLVLLNSMRVLNALDPLVEHDFNRYLKKNKLEQFLSDLGYSFECIDFSAIYYLGTRLLRELFDSSSGYTNPINEMFYNLECKFSGGNFGIQQAYVVKK